MSWSILTPEQRGVLRWLGKRDPDMNREYILTWRPDNQKPVLPNQFPPETVPGGLSLLNIVAFERAGFVDCAWGQGRKSVRFKLTAGAHKALKGTVQAGTNIMGQPANPNGERIEQLLGVMNSRYNREEFKGFCSEISYTYDNLRDSGLRSQMLELIQIMDRHGRFEELWQKVDRERPGLLPRSRD